MGKTFCIIIFFILLRYQDSTCQSKNYVVKLTGRIINYSNQVQVEDMSEIKDFTLPNLERTFLPDSVGNFEVSFGLDKPNYFRVGRNILYLSPGDHLHIDTDFNHPEKAVFKGDGAMANNYLRNTPYPKQGSFLSGEDNIEASFEETVVAVKSIAEERRRLLKSYQKLTPVFKRLENARITADLYNSIGSTQIYYPYVHRLKGDSLMAFTAKYKRYMANLSNVYSKFFVDTGFLKLEVYREVIPFIIEKSTGSLQVKKIRDWMKAKNLAKQVKLSSTRDRLDSFLTITKANESHYKETLLAMLKRKLNLANGDKAVDFQAVLPDGLKMLLSDFKGNVIYVDVWATWCGPCLNELKSLQNLRDLFKGNNDIVFISLSIDDNEQVWKRYLGKSSWTGVQGLIERSRLNDYAVTELPRTIIIDKNFEIVNLNGPLPSDIEANIILSKLLRKGNPVTATN